MLSTNQGLVLRAVKYSETSLICDFFTRDWGLRTYIINGVRQPAPTIAPLLLKPSSLLEFVAYHQLSKEINRLKEAKPLLVYQQIPFVVTHGAVALFICELLHKVLKGAPASTALFDYLVYFFGKLDRCQKGLANLSLIFTAQLTAHLGFTPQISSYTESAYFDYKNGIFVVDKPSHLHYFEKLESQTLVDILCTDAADCHCLQIEKELRATTLSALLDFYSFHIAGFSALQSYKVLQNIF